jgi:hypothetical protein
MYELKKSWKVIYVLENLLGPGPSSYKKRICLAAVSQRLGNTAAEHNVNIRDFCVRLFFFFVRVLDIISDNGLADGQNLVT